MKKTNYFYIVIILMMFACKKEDTTGQKQKADPQKDKEPVGQIENYLNFENATVSGSTHTETLTNNGKGYIIHRFGNGLLPELSTKRSIGATGLKCSAPAGNPLGRARSEIGIKDDIPFGEIRSCAFDIFFDSLFPSGGSGYNSNNWLSFTQFWQYSPGMPIITLEVRRDSNLEYQLVVRNDDTGSEVETARENWPIRGYGTLSRGVWIRFALEVKIDPKGAGYVKLYKNGKLEHTYTGKVGYSTAIIERQGADWRCGIYRTGNYNWPTSTTLWFDEIKYGSTLGDVL